MAALHAACFTVPRPWTRAEFAAFLTDPLAIVLTEPGGLLVGRVVAGEAEVLTLAVAPNVRGAGIGGRLLAWFLTEAGRRGAEAAFLEVAADNQSGLALYRRAGFAARGRRRGYYRAAGKVAASVDAIVLFRVLDRNSSNI